MFPSRDRVEKVKGGLSVDIGIIAFLPGSQVDTRPIKRFRQVCRQNLDFKVLKYDRKRSQCSFVAPSDCSFRKRDRKERYFEFYPRRKRCGRCDKNITDYGIFIDLGGIDGLLHVTDISWGRIAKPAESFHKGEKDYCPAFFLLIARKREFLWA